MRKLTTPAEATVAPANTFYDSNGQPLRAADFKGKLAPGEYTVSWQTAGDDSHISKGDFSFSVAP